MMRPRSVQDFTLDGPVRGELRDVIDHWSEVQGAKGPPCSEHPLLSSSPAKFHEVLQTERSALLASA